MSTPVVVNRAPAFGTQSGVSEGVRCSIKGSDGEEIPKNTIQFYLGSGPAFYEGGVLPEEYENVQFRLLSLFPNPTGPAECTIELDNSLKIVKGAGNLKATYEFGGEQAPADPAATLMGEFTLALAEADVTVDGNDFTGVAYILKADDTGVQIKFFSDGSRWIEIQHANLNTVASPNDLVYKVVYDWDQGTSHTYKLLWDPPNDVLRLYASSGPLEDTPDPILIDGLVSDFSAPLPDGQIPRFVPMAYFGHVYATPESTSYWHNACLHNIVTQPLVSGIARGGHVGFVHTDNVTEYLCEKLPRNTEKPWTILPDSFGTIGGHELISTNKKLFLWRTNPSDSFGFYRVEPAILLDTYTILDFKISGFLREIDPSEGQASGIEVYLDDSTKKIVFGLLSKSGTQSVGLLVESDPHLESSYTAQLANWVTEAAYRIIFRKDLDVKLVRLVPMEEGIGEQDIVSVPYASFPSSDLPGPGIGFLLNGNTVPSLVEAHLGALRYSTNVQRILGSEYPLPSGWVESGSTISTDGTALHIEDTSDATSVVVIREDLKLDSENGFFAECRGKVDSYQFKGEDNPIRHTTGAGFAVDDGAYLYAIAFADAGPPDGKIVFLIMEEDIEENLLKIRAGDLSVIGTYAPVNWSQYHMYRLEKTTGGLVRLFIDNSKNASIEIDQLGFQPASTLGMKAAAFGSFSISHKSLTLWEYFSFGVSMGFDISAFPVLSENEILARFDHAFNSIVEAANAA